MRIIGLTGGIGMGKSTTAATFRRRHIPVFDADRAVHALQAPGGAAIAPIAAAFPGTVHDGTLDRAALRARVTNDPASLKRLEAIIHPLVRHAQTRFLARARRAGRSLVVLDIPLLFEGGAWRLCDEIIVVSAPGSVQRARLRARGRMSEAEIDALIARQMPDAERRRRADVVFSTGIGKMSTYRQLARWLAHRKHR
ncbi:dephospho-CoA kinase [Endobacter medicaginis]|uniref:Dephospho-CoA kinase n=1 Tax=Endobacter medicaginis TaxID=1181271 RepID=A0A839UYZ8_9PROT|nr:dephospho-CoA kinase [Endobacter medicaginis]MBB3172612.1 dephospho-CoA kinase [Endobacter medicaginis]MCX5476853.1 dephospho-CoA kinase [Endobacter medicaginis]NVN29390.1 dephospho-CoA kinase [Endobacter medicaginis]